ncbi:uncharacterized protein LOC112679628 [Sipha flava]|uniref:Uncharacterized protein LOC112679628 n=1 Tax=Sipha flava TaxID=143950 RepID=A0A8B8F3W6_9HEMI|nr:uncharacterized protein LOC112679628 [Sipha flava]
MENFNPKSEFYIRMNKYYLDKPGKKPYTNMKIETIIAEITDAKLNKGAKKIRDYYILQKYDVLTVAEKKYLIHKKTDDKDDIKICKIESTEDFCDLCKTNQKIEEEREAAHIGQNKAAKRMLQVIIPTFNINDCITIPVPKVDRGPLDPTRIIAVIVEKRNELYRVKTEHGLIKGWLSSGNMQRTTSYFISANQVDKQNELTLRETVKIISGGQGFLSCTCKSACQTKRFACFKSSIKCNSRCHNSLNCLNK